MEPERIPDEPHPRAVKMARALLFGLGIICFIAAAGALSYRTVQGSELGWLLAMGLVFLLAAGFGPPRWTVALLVFFLY